MRVRLKMTGVIFFLFGAPKPNPIKILQPILYDKHTFRLLPE